MKDLHWLALRLLHVRYVEAAKDDDLTALRAAWSELQRFDYKNSVLRRMF